jgi:hypothetical protein
MILFLGLSTGCVQEEIPAVTPPLPPEKEMITLYFRDASRPATRALSDSMESIVKTVDLLAFKLSYSQLQFAYHIPVKEADIRSVSGDYTKKEFTVTVENNNDYYRYVLLANAQSEVAAYMASGKHDNQLKDLFLSNIISKNEGLWNTTPGSSNYRYIPMCGESEGDKTVAQLDGTEIKLYRSLARVDVKVDDNVPFTLEKIYVYNRPSRGKIAPDPNLWDVKQNRYIAPSLPSDLGIKNFAGKDPEANSFYAVTGNSSVREIYLYETKEQSAQDFINATFLVLAGQYKGKTNYYRVDFAETPNYTPGDTLPSGWWEKEPPASGTGEGGMVGEGDVYHPLIRNHHYELSITGVSGEGYSSAKEASQSFSTQLTSELLTWDNQDQSVIIDNNTYTLTVTPSTIVSVSVNQSGTVTFDTNYPNPVWGLGKPSVDWLECTLDSQNKKITVSFKTSAALPPKGSEGYFRLRLMSGNVTKVSQQIKVVFN